MGEAALRLQKFLNRSSAFGCLAAIVAVDDLTFDDLEERIKSRLDSKLTDLMRIAGMEIPPLRTRIVRVDERGTSNGQSLADLVHVVHRREGGTGCRNILTCGMPDRQHSGDVLLPPALHDAMLRAWRGKCGLRAVGGQTGRLDVRVGSRLIVVHDDEQIIVGLKCAGDSGKPHVAATQIAAERDRIDRLVLDLAFPLQCAQARRHSDRGGAAGAELRVHPGHNPRRGHVAGIRHVHAAGRARDDRPGTCHLDERAHRCSRLTSLAGAMTRCIEFFQRDFVNAFDLVVNNRFGCHNFSYSLTPIQVTKLSSLSSVLDFWAISYMRMQSSIDTSRPPRPVMTFVIAGRFFRGYSADRTSCIRIPPSSGEPCAKSRSMTPTALKRFRDSRSSMVGNGRNQRRLTKPTLWPFSLKRRHAVRPGSQTVPSPIRTVSASSVINSVKYGLEYRSPKTALNSL